jgi:hypothetical protein
LYRPLEDAQPGLKSAPLRTFEKTRRFCKAAKTDGVGHLVSDTAIMLGAVKRIGAEVRRLIKSVI